MRYLIDTQILIWTMISPQRLYPETKSILQNHEIFVSPITFLEIAIKQKISKLPEFDLSIEVLSNRVEQDGFNVLSLQTKHIAAYATIPLFADHRDPFDRILLATALSENVPIISADGNFRLYSPYLQVIMNS